MDNKLKDKRILFVVSQLKVGGAAKMIKYPLCRRQLQTLPKANGRSL